MQLVFQSKEFDMERKRDRQLLPLAFLPMSVKRPGPLLILTDGFERDEDL